MRFRNMMKLNYKLIKNIIKLDGDEKLGWDYEDKNWGK